LGEWGKHDSIHSLKKNSRGGEKMKLKIGFIVTCTLVLIIGLLNAPLTFAQTWHSVAISTYATDLVEGDPVPEAFRFTVAQSALANTIEVINYDSGENYSRILDPGDLVQVTYLGGLDIRLKSFTPGPVDGTFIIEFEGEASAVSINAGNIPEFSPILAVPLFIIATLLALVYRRKRISQKKD
jgi:hypothetical protein